MTAGSSIPGILRRGCAIGKVTMRHRRDGSYLGLGYPFVSGLIGESTYAVWNWHTGVVASVIYDDVTWRAEAVVAKTSEALNGAWRHDPSMNALHDAEA